MLKLSIKILCLVIATHASTFSSTILADEKSSRINDGQTLEGPPPQSELYEVNKAALNVALQCKVRIEFDQEEKKSGNHRIEIVIQNSSDDEIPFCVRSPELWCHGATFRLLILKSERQIDFTTPERWEME